MKFSEVFPKLQLKNDYKELFEETTITRVVSSTKGDKLHVFLNSDYLIPREHCVYVENQIAKQLFPNSDVQVRIVESFSLKGVYSLESLMKVYFPSILYEADARSGVWGQLLRHADFEYKNDNELHLVLEDFFLARREAEDLLDYLEHVLVERCGREVTFSLGYKPYARRTSLDETEQIIKEKIARISRRANGESGGDDFSDTEISETAISEKAASEPVSQAASQGKASQGNTADSSTRAKSNDAKDKHQERRREWVPAGPDVFYGRDFMDEPVQICDIEGYSGEIVVAGCIRNFEARETRRGSMLVTFDITDYSDTISITMFPKEEMQQVFFDNVKKGAFVIIKGSLGMDRYSDMTIIERIVGIKKYHDTRIKRVDEAPVKRVELHCHTKMSDMDGVTEAPALLKCAAGWGHKALAITDHGVVQAFTEGFHAIGDIKKINPDFKIIYGMEGYLVDDEMELAVNPREHSISDTFVVFDLETTGFSPVTDRIIEIGAVKVENGEIIDRFSTFVNPQIPIPFRVERLTGINDSMVADAPFINDTLLKFLEFAKGSVCVAHNASFDMGFITQKAKDMGINEEFTYVDTVGMARLLMPEISKYKLDTVAKALKVSLENHHRAVDDAEATAEIFLKLCDRLNAQGVTTLAGMNELNQNSDETIRKSNSFHVILLAKNEVGRVNLYRLVSMSHLRYFHGRPKIPKTVLNRYREGLIIGSACEQGELYQAIINEKSEDRIAHIVEFYDYLEIQPNGNNAFMIREDRFENINSEEDLNAINKKIVALGERFHKPVVATCDVHFLNPEDEVYRRILMAGRGFDDADKQAPLYLRTTEEMMKEFMYLGYDKAREVVIDNTVKIADMIEEISPVRPDKCPPVIENSDVTLRQICYRRAHEMYGEELPPQVSERLEKELGSIIKNGFAVMYIIAQKLVWKSVEDGYLVGSRGSVGSSFVATMAGITEVNPLSPHYLCGNCYYVDFTSDEVLAYSGRAGCDMPDKLCPKCGKPLKKEGFDIPFETFLGFKGDKEPDIDLNFSGDYQSKAHKYTEVIFGEGQTFKAGTIGTVADKTAFGYVKNYYEERGVIKRSCEIERIAEGCTGVRRTTGQHPGGIIVLPHGEEIHSFTPVQHPANDMTTDIVTTHFDYHSIDHNLLKLDILGHDDPTMIRMLQDLTGTDPREVALDDKGVMSLFKDTSALNITPDQIGGCRLGCLGVPEFGTDFAMQMLIDTKPTAFSDLVRIAGLSHGTNVWLGNAQTLIEEGTATISTAICTRDDIMVYLIHMGLESETAFKIMENVRKGKVAKKKCDNWEAWKQDMIAHGVPDWYIWSCEKIEYMFPKAHAAAYVMMAWRIAYYKINYPLAYYAAFFSIRASAFSYEMMCRGKDVAAEYLKKYRAMAEDSSVTMTSKEESVLKDLRIVEEMYARGFDFMPIDVFRAKAHHCQIIDGKIMPALDSIDGLSEKSTAVVEAAKNGPFLSKQDFQERTKVSKKIIDNMAELGILQNLPETNQLSLFDFA